MSFCKNCGKELGGQVKFCKHCGSSVVGKSATDLDGGKTEQPKVATNSVSSQQYNGTPLQPKKMSLKSKIIASTAVALIILLFIGYKVGVSMTSHDKIIGKFETALIEKDAVQVASMLKSSSKNLKVTKDSVQGFINYFEENPSEIDFLISHLKGQGTMYDENPEIAKAAATDSYYAINLVHDGKKLLFDTYKISVSPVYFHVYTNYKDSEISLNGEVIATADKDDFSKEIGPFLPGNYTFKAVYQSEYVELETEAVRSNMNPGYRDEVNLYIDGEDVNFYVDFDVELGDVRLYLDGKDTGINVVEQPLVGPLLTDGTIAVSFEADFPWGKMKTEEIPLDSTYMNVYFPVDDVVKEVVQDTVITYNQEYLAAKTTVDPSKFTVASKELVDYVITGFQYDKDYDYYYQGKFIGMDFALDSFELKHYDNWTVLVDAIGLFEEDNYYGDMEPELEASTETSRYFVEYDAEQEKWFVSDLVYAYVDTDNLFEYREENPQIYISEWAK